MEAPTLSLIDQLMPLIYLLGLGIVLSIIFSLVEMFSIDRVLKLVRGRRAFVFLGREAHYGRLHIPPRSKGGFEVFYEDSAVENPLSLVAFLMENYQETGNEKFLEKARAILEYLRERGLVDRELKPEDVKVNPWAPPSLVSRKVYSSELKDLWMIASFVEFMSEEERKRRWRELASLYSRPLFKRTRRKVYNALSYVKDKVASALTSTVSVIAPVPKDLRANLEEAEKRAVTSIIAQSYDPLLENSIGRLVTVRVDDVEGETKLYQGVLAEYSDKYLYVLDVDYRLQMTAVVSGEAIRSSPIVRVFGRFLRLGDHLEIRRENGTIVLRNTSDRLVKVEKVIRGDEEISIDRVLLPGEGVRLEATDELTVHYEISLEADVVWPRGRAVVVGLGDYPPDVLGSILGMGKKLKGVI